MVPVPTAEEHHRGRSHTAKKGGTDGGTDGAPVYRHLRVPAASVQPESSAEPKPRRVRSLTTRLSRPGRPSCSVPRRLLWSLNASLTLWSPFSWPQKLHFSSSSVSSSEPTDSSDPASGLAFSPASTSCLRLEQEVQVLNSDETSHFLLSSIIYFYKLKPFFYVHIKVYFFNCTLNASPSH